MEGLVVRDRALLFAIGCQQVLDEIVRPEAEEVDLVSQRAEVFSVRA
jgi:hypothetical protein